MQFKIVHTTTYAYSAPVSVCHNLLILTPREGSRLRCASHRLVIRPAPLATVRRTDYFGNYVHAFSIEEQHRTLTVTATSRVIVEKDDRLDGDPGPSWEQLCDGIRDQTDLHWLACAPFRFDSPRVAASPDYRAYAAVSFSPGVSMLEGLHDLTTRIHSEFAYDPKATHVNTKTEEVFLNRRGVCQDFAHVQLACMRSLGIPCRYVSGYLRTVPPEGKTKLVGADQTHAWVAAYCGESLGWIEFDPTNDCVCGEDHIPVAWGRDYGDVVPFRGAFIGGGEHTLNVSVDVREHPARPN